MSVDIRRRLLESKVGPIAAMTSEEWLDSAVKLDDEGRMLVSCGENDNAQRAFEDSRLYFQAAEMKAQLENNHVGS